MAGAETELPRVTVIIPVFNDQAGVDACVAALENQVYPADRLEIVIVDNGSDMPVRIDADDAIESRIIRCETPGAYAARNAGIEAAKGDVLAFTDADCIPNTDWIARGVDTLLAGRGDRIVGGDVRMRLSERPSAVELYQGIAGFEQRENIEERGFTVTANLFVKRDAIRRIGAFATDLLSGGDLEFSRRAVARGCELVFAPDAVVETLPRQSLRSAARQARRVAGGRRSLREGSAGEPSAGPVGPRRGVLQSLRWILGRRDLGWWDRLRVLAVATLLYGVRIAENLRLALGREPERR